MASLVETVISMKFVLFLIMFMFVMSMASASPAAERMVTMMGASLEIFSGYSIPSGSIIFVKNTCIF